MSSYAENSDDDCLVHSRRLQGSLGVARAFRASAMKDRRAAEALPMPIVLYPIVDTHQRRGTRGLRIGSKPKRVRF